ncbi:MAG: hypothetical protein ACXW18_03995 [Pyrinomonadaceae bacterium]
MPTTLRRFLFSVATVLVLAAAMLVLHSHLRSHPELSYPPSADQINYLDEAPEFQQHLLVDPKVPLYTVWFSVFYATAPNLYWCFYIERYALILLLSVLVAFLGYRLFDRRTGLMLGLTVLNMKYFVIEPNGSNGLAAAMVVAAALCLTSRKSLRWPAAIFFLYLSALARPEMVIALALVMVYLLWKVIVWFRRKRRESGKLLGPSWYQWACLLVIVASMAVFIKTHANVAAPWSPTYAYFAAFAVNYVKRANLTEKYPRPWSQSAEIIHEVMPKVTEPVSPLASPLRGIIQAWTLYPKECLGNTAFNVKMAAITLPAIMVGFSSRLFMLIAIVGWIGSYFFLRGSSRQNFAQTPARIWRDLIVLAVANLSLIGVTLFFLVMWRYYFPLLPVFMVGWAYLVHRSLDLIQKRRRL